MPYICGMENINIINHAQTSKTYEEFLIQTGSTHNGACAYRSIITEQETGLDMNFGFVLVREKYKHNGLYHGFTSNGWCQPWDFHCWNEDDDNIYDDLRAYNGFNLPKNLSVRIVDWNDKKFKTLEQFQKALKSLTKMMKNSNADMIYVCGVGDNVGLNSVIDWETMESQIIPECCENIYEYTGTTMNNVVI